jgi:NADH-quinone oxidoreductase subunit N
VSSLVTAAAQGPTIDVEALSPLIALAGGAIVVLLTGLLRPRFIREGVVPAFTLIALGAALGLSIWQWDSGESIISGALRVDTLSLALTALFVISAALAVVLSWRALAPRESAHGEYYAMLLVSVGGMSVLVQAQNLVALFLGFELLSIPLYVLCATEMRRATSLEAGLKYLVIGSVGSATLLYGLAFVYGATGETDFGQIAASLNSLDGMVSDPLFLTGLALALVGLAFKASVAPFHQWTPDVYEGAPTPITAFMATATKAAASVARRVRSAWATPSCSCRWSP